MFGVMVRVDTTQNLNLDPNPQNETVEGHNLSLQNCFSTLNSRRPLHLMMTPVCPRLLNLNNDFVLLRF